MKVRPLLFAGISLFVLSADSRAEIKVVTDHSEFGLGFTFKSVPAPANNDAGTAAKFRLVAGEHHANGGDLSVLHDGRVPSTDDQPSANFFFRDGTNGGRILIDLGHVIAVKQVGSYSWHSGSRGPQVYKLYGADGTADGFTAGPMKEIDPATCGWTFIASLDTRPKDDVGGGQHGVAITSSHGTIGQFRYLLFDLARAGSRDAYGNTFFSEIDVIDADGPAPISTVEKPILKSFDAQDGKFRFYIDVTEAPELADWAGDKLKNAVQEWYPQIVAMLPSEGYQAPSDIMLRFRSDMGNTPASAYRSSVSLNRQWFRGELEREACGAVVHELVHVVQNYRRAQRDPKVSPTPSWIVEGIADYIRWFHFEPQSKGAEITNANLIRARFDSSYRITGNFLNWVSQTYDKEIVRKLNAAAREGKYTEKLWKDWTSKTVQELGDEWKKSHEQRVKSTSSH